MPYIGRAATNTGSVRYLDDISSGFDGSETDFTAQVGGINITPDQESVYVFLNGVFQHPGASEAYTISGSTLSFSTAPSSGVKFTAHVAGAGVYLDDKAVSSNKLDDDAVVASKLDDDGTGFQVGDLGIGGSISGSDKLTVTGSSSFTSQVKAQNFLVSGSQVNWGADSGTSGRFRIQAGGESAELSVMDSNTMTFKTADTLALTIGTNQSATFAGTVDATHFDASTALQTGGTTRIDSSGVLNNITGTDSATRNAFDDYFALLAGASFSGTVGFGNLNISNSAITQLAGDALTIKASGATLDLKADYDSTGGSIRFYPTNNVLGLTLASDNTATFAGKVYVGGATGLGTSKLQVQGTSTTSLGDPQMVVYGRTNNGYQTIGLGHIEALYPESPAEIGFLETNNGGGTYGDLIFATRAGTTGAPTTRLTIASDGNATFSGDVTIGTNILNFDTGEKIFSTSGYVVVDGNSGFIIRDDGDNKFIANGNTFRGDGNNAQYLGSSSIRFANTYTQLLNVAGDSTFTGDVTIGDASAKTSLTIDGSGAGWTGADIIFQTDHGNRGGGMFIYNTATDHEWYWGTPYQGSDKIHLCYESTASFTQQTAEDTHSVFNIDSSGNATFASNISASGLITTSIGDSIFGGGEADSRIYISNRGGSSGDDSHFIRGDSQRLSLNAGGSNGEVSLEVNGGQELKILDGTATFTGDVYVGASGTKDLYADDIFSNGGIFADQYIYHTGDTNTHIRFSANENIEITANANKIMRFEGNVPELVINEDSADIDFRVESDNNTHALFVRGSDGKVGINIDNPVGLLSVGPYAPTATMGVYGDVAILSNSNSLPGELAIRTTDSTTVADQVTARIYLESQDGGESTLDASTVIESIASEDQASSNKGSHLAFRTKANATAIGAAATERMRITSAGNVGIGTSSPAELLHVKKSSGEAKISVDGTTYSTMLFKEGGSDQWAMGYDASNNRFFINEEGVASQLVIADGGNATFAGTVGLNGLTNSSYDAGADDLVLGQTSGNGGLTIVSGTSNVGYINFADGTSGDEKYRGYIYFNHDSGDLGIVNRQSGTSERLIIKSDGALEAPGDIYSTGQNIRMTRQSTSQVSRLWMTTSAGEDSGAWVLGMNLTGATTTNPDFRIQRWTGSDTTAMTIAHDLSTTFAGTLDATGAIYSKGSEAIAKFDNRVGASTQWGWYATGDVAYLWQSVIGALISVENDGDTKLEGDLTIATGKLYAPANVNLVAYSRNTKVLEYDANHTANFSNAGIFGGNVIAPTLNTDAAIGTVDYGGDAKSHSNAFYTSAGSGEFALAIRSDSQTGNGLFVRAGNGANYTPLMVTAYDENHKLFSIDGTGSTVIGENSSGNSERFTENAGLTVYGMDNGAGSKGHVWFYNTNNSELYIRADGAGSGRLYLDSFNSGGEFSEIHFRDSSAGFGDINTRGKIYTDNNARMWFTNSSQYSFSGNVYPSADNSKDLGSSSLRWANLYVADMQMNNVGTGGNDVDGTEGSWTIQEGEDDLFLLNRKNGKKYKFKLEAV